MNASPLSKHVIAAASDEIFASRTYQELAARYPLMVTVVELSSITREASQTIRNRLSQNTYPIVPIRIERRVLFRLSDVATFLDNLAYVGVEKTAGPAGSTRRRGRPSKVEQQARVRRISEQKDGAAA